MRYFTWFCDCGACKLKSTCWKQALRICTTHRYGQSVENKNLEYSLPIDIVSFWIWKWFDLDRKMGWKNIDGLILRKHSMIGAKVWGANLQAGFKLLCISNKKCRWQKTFAQKPKQIVTQLEEIRYFFWAKSVLQCFACSEFSENKWSWLLAFAMHTDMETQFVCKA